MSDLLRCALMKQFGGTYFDSDIISKRSIDELTKSFISPGIVFAWLNSGTVIVEINNTPLMFRRDNPVIDLIMKEQVRILKVQLHFRNTTFGNKFCYFYNYPSAVNVSRGRGKNQSKILEELTCNIKILLK